MALVNVYRFHPERGDIGEVYRSMLRGQETFPDFNKILLDAALPLPTLFGQTLTICVL